MMQNETFKASNNTRIATLLPTQLKKYDKFAVKEWYLSVVRYIVYCRGRPRPAVHAAEKCMR